MRSLIGPSCFWITVVAVVATASCNAPKPRPDQAPLVGGSAQASPTCAMADWRSARLCEDDACLAASLGPECVACAVQLATSTCDACLGERLCAHPDNTNMARQLVAPRTDAPEDVRFHKVGKFPIGGLEGASRDGEELVVVAAAGLIGETRRSSAAPRDHKTVVSPGTYSVLTSNDQLLWQIPGSLDECLPPTVSPMGRWVATVCDSTVRVYELATGFLHHEVEVAHAVETIGLLELSNLSPLYHCFGGDAWLALRTDDGWHVIDLEDGSKTPVETPADDAVAQSLMEFRLDDDDGVRVALSWDGSHIAVAARQGNGVISVLAVEGSGTHDIDVRSTVNDFTFDGVRSIIVHEAAGYGRVNLAGDRLDGPTAPAISDQIAGGRSWWVRVVESYGADVWQPLAPKPLVLIPAPRDTGRSYSPPRGLLALDTVVALDDGRFVGGAPSFGVTFFDADGGVIGGPLGRGEALWLTAIDGSREVVIGHDDGVRIWNIDTFESRALELPPAFAQTPPHFMDGFVVATGSTEQPFTGLERDDRLLVTTPNGKEHQLTLDGAIEAVARVGESLHVATRTGIWTFDPSLDDPKPRAAHRFPNALEPVKGESAKFSADGKFALVLEDARAKLYETADYTRSIDTFAASSCAFSSQVTTMACLTVAKDRSVRLHSYDLVHRTEIASHSADSNAAKALSILRVVDVTNDGQHIVLGRGNQWISIADLRGGELLGPRGKHAAFVGDEVASTDGVYLYAADLAGIATSRDRLPD